MTKRILAIAITLAALIVVVPRQLLATHEATVSGNAVQNLTAQPDQTIVASAAATPVAGCGADAFREAALVRVESGSIRLGDSTVSSTVGIPLNATDDLPLAVEATSALFAYSDAGAVITCSPIDR